MGQFIFKLPDLGEGTVESEIATWRIRSGEHIRMDEPLVDMMTDKATVEITSPVSGKVLSLAGKVGDVVAVGAELAVFETDASGDREDQVDPETERLQAKNATQTGPDGQTAPSAAEAGASQRPLASPSIRRRAREAGIDLAKVPASHADNRISHADLDRFIAAAARPEQSAPGEEAEFTEVAITGIRRKIAEKMLASMRSIPHFWLC